MRSWLLIGLLSGCAPTYWVRHPDLLAAQAGAPKIEGERGLDGENVQLDGAALRGAAIQRTSGNRVLVKPPASRALKIGRALLWIGGSFLSGAVVAAATYDSPRGCHDEECWLAQMTATGVLGNLAAIFLSAGSGMAIAARYDAER